LLAGIGDDCAIWQPRAGHQTILTCDWFLEDTHFRVDRHPPESIGWKCLARAVSDIAAMGGEPRCFLLSLALPQSRTKTWMDKFLSGLRHASRKLHCPAAGGDTTRDSRVLISITVVGECRHGAAVPRSGAKPGDAIFVTGRLGEAEYGFRLLGQMSSARATALADDPRLRKHLHPEPRIPIGAWLAKRRLATAMMDLSDGLSTDLPRLCNASSAGAEIHAGSLPCVQIAAKGAKHPFDPLALALHGGDDYELLFTVAQRNAKRIPSAIGGVQLTRIGEITASRKIVLLGDDGSPRPLSNQGWDPFR
jgi:thiamine-monophosphate kinase